MQLPPRKPSCGGYATPVAVDPFAIGAQEREALLDAALAAVSRPAAVVGAQAGVNAKRQHRHFAATDGTRQHQHLIETGALLVATASAGDQVQRRSFPNSFHGNTGGAGWEI